MQLNKTEISVLDGDLVAFEQDTVQLPSGNGFIPILAGVEMVVDTTGNYIVPSSMALVGTTRDGNGYLLTETISDGTSTWVRTATRDVDGNLQTLSRWVKQ